MVDGSTIAFRSDGTGTFMATTLTYHTTGKDIWHHQVTVYSINGRPLFTLPTWDSPDMSDGKPPPRYPWSRGFTFDPAIFSAIGAPQVTSLSC
jgi:hypothetical protein